MIVRLYTCTRLLTATYGYLRLHARARAYSLNAGTRYAIREYICSLLECLSFTNVYAFPIAFLLLATPVGFHRFQLLLRAITNTYIRIP